MKAGSQEKLQLQLCLAEPPVFGSKRNSDMQLAEYIARIYKTLSDHIHSNKSPAEYRQKSTDRLEVVKGPLRCMCKAFSLSLLN